MSVAPSTKEIVDALVRVTRAYHLTRQKQKMGPSEAVDAALGVLKALGRDQEVTS